MSSEDSSRPEFSTERWLAGALLGAVPDAPLMAAEQQQVLEAAVYHGLAPLLHHVLQPTPSWEALPPALREGLTGKARQAMALDMLREQDLGPLLDRFAADGIRCLLMKGTGLAYTHYERSYLRERADTDILFAGQADFDRAWALLESLGYRRRNTLSGEFVGYQHCCWRPLGRNVDQWLDCHIRVNDYLFYADALGFEELWEQSVAVPQLSTSARTLGPVHALLLACMHRVATMPLGNADRLIWLYDLHLLGPALAAAQWDEVLRLARERGVAGSCLHSLRAAAEYFPVGAPESVLAGLERAAAEEPFQPGREMKRWTYYYHVFRTVPGVGGKLRLLREHFLPAPEYLLEKYQTDNRLALPWLYLRRVFGGMKRYF